MKTKWIETVCPVCEDVYKRIPSTINQRVAATCDECRLELESGIISPPAPIGHYDCGGGRHVVRSPKPMS